MQRLPKLFLLSIDNFSWELKCQTQCKYSNLKKLQGGEMVWERIEDDSNPLLHISNLLAQEDYTF